MRSKITDILIGLLVGGVMAALYSLSEDYLFLKLSISTTDNTPRYIMRILLGIPTMAIVVLVTWILRLHSKFNKLKQKTEPDIAQRVIEARKKTEQLLKTSPLDSTQVGILKLLFSQNMSTEQIADSLGLQLQSATYHLTELTNLNMIILERSSKPITNYGPWPSLQKQHSSAWTLKQPGRKYLLDNKLVES